MSNQGSTMLPKTQHLDFARFTVPVLATALLIWLLLSLMLNNGGISKELAARLDELSAKCDRSPGGPDGKLELDGRSFQDIVVRDGFRGPRDLCHLPEEQLKDILGLPHSCRRNESRVWYEGRWLRHVEVEEILASPKLRGRLAQSCVIYCTDHQPPCVHDKCLIPLYLRRNTSDALVANQLMEAGHLDVLQPHMKVQRILDAGANIGIASAVMATAYPHASIVAVEPSRKNFDMLRLNTGMYRNVIPINSGLWPRITTLYLAVEGTPTLGVEWGFRAFEKDQVPSNFTVVDTLQGVSMRFLMTLLGLREFDVLKVDIEGTELELFTPAADNWLGWLDSAKMMVIEGHQWFRSGSNDAISQAMAARPRFKWVGRSGEYHVYKDTLMIDS